MLKELINFLRRRNPNLADDAADANTLAQSETSAAQSNVDLFDGDSPPGSAEAIAVGFWAVTPNALGGGADSFTVPAIDWLGNSAVSVRTDSAPQSPLTVNTVPAIAIPNDATVAIDGVRAQGTYRLTTPVTDRSGRTRAAYPPMSVMAGAVAQSPIFVTAPPVTVGDGATVEIDGISGQSVTFAGSTGDLILNDGLAFTGKISGLAGSDAIDLVDVSYGANTQVTFLGNDAGGTLTITNGSQTANIALVGNYLSSTWNLANDGNGGTVVVDPTSSNNWETLKVGAGGFITGIDVAPDGTMVARTDTYGAYIWNGTEWQQLVTSTSMPAAFTTQNNIVTLAGMQGVYEIQIAPSNSSVIYMMYDGYVFQSTNKGTTWTQTAFAQVTANSNNPVRNDGQEMAVDPENPDVVYVGTPQNGLFVSTNGGATWQSVSGVPLGVADSGGSYPGIDGILFDPALGVTGGMTNTIFAASYGKGVYESTNGGTSWSAIGGPSDVVYAAVSSTGVYYASDGTTLWSYANGTWTQLVSNGSQGDLETVAVDPFNPNEIVTQSPAGYLNISYNAGATWSEIDWSSNELSSTDIPWLASANTEASGGAVYLSVGGLAFDPLVPNELIASAGTGVWVASNLPTQNLTGSVVWDDQSIGIEQLVANEIIVPPGGDPVLASWDRPFFYINNLNAYPSTYGPVASDSIVAGWSVDYASSDPSFLVGIADWWGVEESGYSTNGGQTWTPFPSFIPGADSNFIGGTIAASTPENIIWAPADGHQPYYTLNGGATWNAITLPGVSSWSGFDFAYYLDTRTVTADRVLANTFYLYYAGQGVFETTNGGATWTKVFSGQISAGSGDNAELESVPGEAGNLFFTGGPQGGSQPVAEQFYQSTNGGAAWTAIPNVDEVICFGFGAAAPGQSYPAIYIVGYVNNVYGIWQSINNAQSWTQIGTYPNSDLDNIKTISGDPNIYGQVYVGFTGSGYAVLVAPPSVTSVAASPLSGNESTGQVITLTLNMTAIVTVTGTPTLSLNDGGTASYTGGSGTNVLTFSYTVAAGQSTAALAITGANLPNGATVTDDTGIAAVLTGAVTSFAGLQIGAPGPAVTSLVESPSSGDLNTGNTVTLTLGMSEVATVNTTGGTPTLTLNDGGTATYTGGSGTSTLTFSYTVTAGQNTAALAATSLNLNGAAIADGAGNAANLSLSGLTQTGPQIGTPPPVISAIVESPSSGDLDAGTTVTLTLDMSAAVTVNTSGGTPTLTLNDGGSATYQSGSGTSALVFSYTVVAGQNTAGLTATAVNLNGATIANGSGSAANLSLTGLAQTGPQVDTTTPTISSLVESPSSGDLNTGNTVTLTLGMSEVATVNTTGGTPTLTLNDGGTATYQSGSGTSALVFSYTVAAGQNTAALAATSFNLNGATIKDGAGNAANLSLNGLTQNGPQINVAAPALAIDGNAFSNSDATVPSAAVTLTTAHANDVIILNIVENNSTVASVADTAGLTWHERAVAGSGSDLIYQYYAIAPSALSADTITVNFTGSPAEPYYVDLNAFGISGANTSSPFDTNVAIPATANSGTASATTSNANDLIFAAYRFGSDSNPSAGAGWTANNASGDYYLSEYQVVSATQTGLAASASTTDENGGIVDAVVAATATSGPTITSLAESPSSGDLDAGKTVTLTLNMSEVATVNTTGGTPTLTLNDGSTATYTGGSGTSALTFSYTVGAGQNIAALATTAVNLNGATITDGAGNAANFSLTGLTQSGPQIDTTTPTISAIGESPSSGDLDAGKTVTYTLTTSEVVTVNTTSGSPTLSLNDGGTATYTGGSGTNALTFSYKVLAGQNTPDLKVSTVNLSGATISDGAGNAANLSITGLTQGSPQIDTTPPTVASVTAAAGDYDAGKVLTLTLNMSEAANATGSPTLTLNDGGTASYVSGSGSSALVFSYTVAAGQNTAALQVTGVTGTITDLAGNALSNSNLPETFTGVIVDTTAPTITSLVESPSSGDLNAGKTITLTLGMSEVATVNTTGGTPTLTLNDGSTATYTGGSGTSALTFSYTVGAGQNIAALATTAVNLNGATITDGAGNAANFSLTGLTQSGPQIDTTTPTISAIGESPSSGDLNAGKTVTYTLTTSEVVTVNTTSGSPTLSLNDGGTATYVSGSGTNALTFSYTVLAGQNTPDLKVSTVNLSGATISDGAGNAANLSISGLTQGSPQIDTTPPTVASLVESPSSGDLDAGKTITLTLGMSEVATVNTTGGTPTLTLNDGSTATYTGGSGTSALTFSYTVGAGQNIAALATTAVNLNGATITDGAGNAANFSLTGLTQSGPEIGTLITAVAESPSSGALGAGKTVTLTLDMSAVVTVNTSGGTPTLALNDGGTATYTGGSGTDALTFSYTVAAGQNTAALAATSFNLNGATITDGVGEAADPSLSGLTQTGPQIDTTTPTVSSVTVAHGGGNVVSGVHVTITLNMSEIVEVTGTPVLSLNDGGTATYTGGSGTSALTFSYMAAAGQNTMALQLTGAMSGGTIADAAGNTATIAPQTLGSGVNVDQWTAASGGYWNTKADWSSPAGAPASFDLAVLNAAGTYQVTSTTNQTIAELNTDSTTTLEITKGSTFTITAGTGAGVQAGTVLIEKGSTLDISGAFDNTGTLWAQGGILNVDGSLTGGTTEISGAGQATLATASNENVLFQPNSAGKLVLDQATTYTGQISGFGVSQSIDLVGFNFADVQIDSYVPNGSDTAGVLTITDGAETAQFNVEGAYTLANFSTSNDGSGGTLLTDPTVKVLNSNTASADVAEGEVLVVDAPDNGKVTFTGSTGTLWLNQPSTFTGTVSGFGAQNAIDLPGIAFDDQTTLAYSPNSNGHGGILSITDGAQSAKIAILGHFLGSSFALETDHHNGTMVVEALTVGDHSLLTHPQHA